MRDQNLLDPICRRGNAVLKKALSPIFFSGVLNVFFKMLAIINHLECTVIPYYPMTLFSNIRFKNGARVFSVVMRRM